MLLQHSADFYNLAKALYPILHDHLKKDNLEKYSSMIFPLGILAVCLGCTADNLAAAQARVAISFSNPKLQKSPASDVESRLINDDGVAIN